MPRRGQPRGRGHGVGTGAGPEPGTAGAWQRKPRAWPGRASVCTGGALPVVRRTESPLREWGPCFWGEACSVHFQTTPYPPELISRISTSVVQCSHGQPFSDLPALPWTIHFQSSDQGIFKLGKSHHWGFPW